MSLLEFLLHPIQTISEHFDPVLKAALDGDVEAQYALAKRYENEGETEAAVAWYQEAAGKGHAEAQYQLGWIQSTDIYGVESAQESFDWYMKAARQEHGKAQYEVARVYDFGDGSIVAQDSNEAYKWYLKAADNGEEVSQFRVGDAYARAEYGFERNLVKGFEWYGRSAQQGYSEALYHFGLFQYFGVGTEKDEEAGLEWIERAVEEGHSTAQTFLETKQIHKWWEDPVASFEGNLAAAEAGDAEAQFQVAKAYRLSGDRETENHWLHKAAEAGHVEAQLMLAENYSYGGGVPQDHVAAFKWFSEAAEQGHADAQYGVGFAYASGYGVELDERKAFEWYRQAAEQGQALAERNLGDAYSEGRVVRQDLVEAFRWYKRAAERGGAEILQCTAWFRLGVCYYYGIGTEKNEVLGEEWIEKAAGADMYDAKKFLEDETSTYKWWERCSTAVQSMVVVDYLDSDDKPSTRIVPYPGWIEIEGAVKMMDNDTYPFVLLSRLTCETVEEALADEDALIIVGAVDRCALYQKSGGWRHCNPDGSDVDVELGRDDFYHACKERNLLTDPGRALRMVRDFHEYGWYDGLSEVE